MSCDKKASSAIAAIEGIQAVEINNYDRDAQKATMTITVGDKDVESKAVVAWVSKAHEKYKVDSLIAK